MSPGSLMARTSSTSPSDGPVHPSSLGSPVMGIQDNWDSRNQRNGMSEKGLDYGDKVNGKEKPKQRLVHVALMGVVLLACALWLLRPDEGLFSGRGASIEDICDPWDEPGYTFWNRTAPLASHWQTIQTPSQCQPPNHLAHLLDLSLAHNDAKLKYLAGKTVIILGDYLDHQGANHLCNLLSEDGRTRAHDIKSRGTPSTKSRFTVAAGRVCEAPRLDFRFAWFELDASAQGDVTSLSADRAEEFQRRLKEVIYPALKSALHGKRIDLIVLSPGFNDLVTAGRQDEMHRSDLYAPIDAARMERLNIDLLSVVQSVQRAWRKTPIALRSLPRAVNPARKGHVSRFIQDIRVYQIRTALKSIAQRSNLAFFDVAHAINGYQKRDDELSFSPGGVLYAKGLLHQLVAVQSSRRRPARRKIVNRQSTNG